MKRPIRMQPVTKAILGLAPGFLLAGCGGMPDNRGLEPLHQPVVSHTQLQLDLVSMAGGGLGPAEQGRLAGWFEALALTGSDRVTLYDPDEAPATREAVTAIAGHFGVVPGGVPGIDPAVASDGHQSSGALLPGRVRVVIARATASVPGCPDWATHSDANFNNATSRNYGCAIRSNLAAMVADKDDLVRGVHDTGDNSAVNNTKAIQAWRAKAPTGTQDLKEVSSKAAGAN